MLHQVAQQGAVAPGLWPLETAKVLLATERRGRLTLTEWHQAFALLAKLPIRVDGQTAARAWKDTISLAAAQKLTVYDASYLELPLRLAMPLTSLDRALRKAAEECGALVLPWRPHIRPLPGKPVYTDFT